MVYSAKSRLPDQAFNSSIFFPHTLTDLSLSLLELHCSPLSPFALQRAANMIPAHDSPLAALAFDASGTKLATASEKVNISAASHFSISYLSASPSSAAICHVLAGNCHSRLLHSGGPEALWVPERSQKVKSLAAEPQIATVTWFLRRPLHFPSGASASARWHSASMAYTCRPPATQRRCTSSNLRPRRKNTCKWLLRLGKRPSSASPPLVMLMCLAGRRRSPPRGEATWARCWWLPQPTCLPRSRKCSPKVEPSPPSDCPFAATRTSAP